MSRVPVRPVTLLRMRTQRQVVDYALQRRALLREVYAGRTGLYEVCDASPYLKTAARFHGEATEDRCPICRREFLTRVHYIYGDELKQSAGQARSRAELATLASMVREFQVFVVENPVVLDVDDRDSGTGDVENRAGHEPLVSGDFHYIAVRQ